MGEDLPGQTATDNTRVRIVCMLSLTHLCQILLRLTCISCTRACGIAVRISGTCTALQPFTMRP